MQEIHCQSCGMPLREELYGTNSDGSKTETYCKYCFQNGVFSFEGTMEEMIEACIPHMATEETGMSPEQARTLLCEVLPTLKRWNT